jgi:hypothetical protein
MGNGPVPAHRKAMAVHRALAFLYGAITLFCAIVIMAGIRDEPDDFIVPLFFSVPAVLHGFIAFGAARGNRVAQVFSVLAALFLLLGFPIGTAIGIYLLCNAAWKTPAPAIASGTEERRPRLSS